MKKKDAILIGAVLALAIVIWAGMMLLRSEDGNQLKVSVDGNDYGFYSLEIDQTIEIGSGNVCQIKDGAVTMIEADCPDHLCIQHKAISKEESGSIICLPNRVVLEIVNDSNDQDPVVIAMKTGGFYDFIYKGNGCRG